MYQLLMFPKGFVNCIRMLDFCSYSALGFYTLYAVPTHAHTSAHTAAIANRPESRGDILSALQDALTVVDVSVVHPAAATQVNVAARADGSAAAVRDHAKRAQYENSDPLRCACVPLSTETFGRLGKPAMALQNKLAERASASGVVFKDDVVGNALRELSVGLCRGNFVLCKCSLYALARVSGTAFRAGADIPTSEIN